MGSCPSGKSLAPPPAAARSVHRHVTGTRAGTGVFAFLRLFTPSGANAGTMVRERDSLLVSARGSGAPRPGPRLVPGASVRGLVEGGPKGPSPVFYKPETPR